MPARVGDSPERIESSYVFRGDASPDAVMASLRALIHTRERPRSRRRFTLLDTFDGRVRRAGARLTQSDRDGASAWTWQGGGRSPVLDARLDEPAHFAWDLPPGPMKDAIEPIVGVRRMLALADADEHVSELDVLDDRSKTVARLRLTSGRVRRAESRSQWRPLAPVLTLTALGGYEAVHERLRPLVESRPGLEPAADGCDGVILRQVGLSDAVAVNSRTAIEWSTRADVAARAIHADLVRVLVLNEPGLRADLDTEFLHDYRVALRRMRSLLGQIKDVFPDSITTHFSVEWSWLARLTGPARDLDVLLLALRESNEVPSSELDAVRELLALRKKWLHGELVAALDSRRYRRLLRDWSVFLGRSAPAQSQPRNAARPIRELVSERARRLCRRIGSGAAAIGAHTPPEAIHDVRIAAKKLRYVLDVSPSFYDARDLGRVLGGLKKLQRVLGDFNDACVQSSRLLELAPAVTPGDGRPGVVVTLGHLADERRRRAELARHEVRAALDTFIDGNTRSICRRLFKKTRDDEVAK